MKKKISGNKFSEEEKVETRNKYLSEAIKHKIKLIIIGQDPYPTGSNGIAFCKDTFKEMNKNCCGRYVLESVTGEKFDIIKEKYKTPSLLFDRLLYEGVLFINLSNKIIKKLTKEELESEINNCKSIINTHKKEFPKIVKCGKYCNDKFTNIDFAVHPVTINKNIRNKEWRNYWEIGKLKKIFAE